MIRIPRILMLAAVLLPCAATALTDEQAETGHDIRNKIFQKSVREVSIHRNNCMAGLAPTAKDGFDKDYIVDICVAALNRTASDNRLSDLYKGLLARLHADDDVYAKKLPGLIGKAVYKNRAAITVDSRQMQITPGLAFDAGFAAGYEVAQSVPETLSEDQLRSFTQTCLSNAKADLKGCYSIGAVYGMRAQLVYKGVSTK